MALAFGPLIGGFISQHLHWGWIFFINVPVGIISVLIAAFTMNESKRLQRRRRLDLPACSPRHWPCSRLTYGLIEGHDKGWTSGSSLARSRSPRSPAPHSWRSSTRSEHPMVPRCPLFRSRVYSGGTVT